MAHIEQSSVFGKVFTACGDGAPSWCHPSTAGVWWVNAHRDGDGLLICVGACATGGKRRSQKQVMIHLSKEDAHLLGNHITNILNGD